MSCGLTVCIRQRCVNASLAIPKQFDQSVAYVLQDLRDSVEALRRDPNCVKDGKAPVYGMANVNPDRSMVGEILVAVQDNLLD